jgi:transposase-like protein
MRFAFDDDSTTRTTAATPTTSTSIAIFRSVTGTADTSADVLCPYCGETNTVGVDPGSGEDQSYVEDCQVCCQPWRVSVHYRSDGTADITATALDD